MASQLYPSLLTYIAQYDNWSKNFHVTNIPRDQSHLQQNLSIAQRNVQWLHVRVAAFNVVFAIFAKAVGRYVEVLQLDSKQTIHTCIASLGIVGLTYMLVNKNKTDEAQSQLTYGFVLRDGTDPEQNLKTAKLFGRIGLAGIVVSALSYSALIAAKILKKRHAWESLGLSIALSGAGIATSVSLISMFVTEQYRKACVESNVSVPKV
jgi:hypothetical protein